jgi:hypothetical protein
VASPSGASFRTGFFSVVLGKEGFMSRKITIGNKTVLAAEPYRVQNGLPGEFVGREMEQKLITASWLCRNHAQPLSPILVGDPGVGKNRIAYELAARTGKELFIVQGHEDLSAEDLACQVRFADDGKGMDYILSPLLTAMDRGGICLLDEIGKIRHKALALLVSVLDERRYADSVLLGERVKAASGFRFLAATNTSELTALPDFVRSRLRPVVRVGYPSKNEINAIVERRFPKQDFSDLLPVFWSLWKTHGGRSPAPRDAVFIFGLAQNFADLETMENGTIPGQDVQAFTILDSCKLSSISSQHLELAFQAHFAQPN